MKWKTAELKDGDQTVPDNHDYIVFLWIPTECSDGYVRWLERVACKKRRSFIPLFWRWCSTFSYHPLETYYEEGKMEQMRYLETIQYCKKCIHTGSGDDLPKPKKWEMK